MLAAAPLPGSATLLGHIGPVNSVAFSPDGKTLASGSADDAVRLWDVATHHKIGDPLVGHIGTVQSVAFNLGRASRSDSEYISVVAGSLKKKDKQSDVGTVHQIRETP